MDDRINEIVHMIAEVNELGYMTYKPLVDNICKRKASKSEVENLSRTENTPLLGAWVKQICHGRGTFPVRDKASGRER